MTPDEISRDERLLRKQFRCWLEDATNTELLRKVVDGMVEHELQARLKKLHKQTQEVTV